MALRYLRTPPGLPSRYDEYGESFTLQHGLDCSKGGLLIRRHNEIRDCLGDMAALVWPQVIREPVVQEGDPASDDPGLRLDLGIWGVWQPQVEALFDIRVIDNDAPSYQWHSPVSFLTLGLLKRREFIIQLWRTEEETLHFLFCRLMACCSVRLRTLSSVYLPTWPLDGRNLFLMF